MATAEQMTHDLSAAIRALSFNSLHAGSPRQDVQRAYGEGFDRCRREAADLVSTHTSAVEEALTLALGSLALHDFDEAKRIGALVRQEVARAA